MKNAKKILLFALALVALTLVMSLSIFAKVVEVDTMNELVAATNNGSNGATVTKAPDGTTIEDGDTILFTKDIDVTGNTYLYVKKAITIDLNGYTLSTHSNYCNIRLQNDGIILTSSRLNPDTGKQGKITYSGTNAAIKVWNADTISNIDIECTYDDRDANGNVDSAKTRQVGGIVMQEAKVHINSIEYVNIYGYGLAQGIQTYNCGGYTNDDGTPWVVIDKISNVNIDATNNRKVPAEGMNIYAPIGTVEDSVIHGTDIGVHVWSKGPYNTAIAIENCEVKSTNGTALSVHDNGGSTTLDLSVDSATTFESTNGTAISVSVPNAEKFDIDIAGYVQNEDGSISACTEHTWKDATCTSPKTCSKCNATEGKAIPHTYEITEKVDAKPGVEGSVTYTCSGCGDTYSETIEALPEHTHTPVEIPAVLPTPSKVGYTAGVKCSECDEVLEAPVEIPALGIDPNYTIYTAALNLNDCLNMIYKTTIPAGYANPYMVFVFNGQETTVTEYTVEAGTGYYCFKFPGITPLYMSENIHATLHADVNGEDVTKVVPSFSVKRYAQNMMNYYPNNTKLVTVLSDLLTYGAQTQIMMNINTDNLPTAGLTLKPSTYTELDASYNKLALNGTADGMVTWQSPTLNLSNSVNMLFRFKATDVEGLAIKITIKDRVHTFDVSQMTATNGVYEIKFTNITALEFNEAVTAVAVKNGVESTQNVTFSINSYVYAFQAYENDPRYASVVAVNKAMYNYGASVEAYAGKN